MKNVLSGLVRSSVALALLAGPSVEGFSSQGIPGLTNVKVETQITRSGDVFTYNYVVTNDSATSASIWVLETDISQPAGGAQLSGQGLISGSGFLEGLTEAVLTQSFTVPMVPATMQAPPNWLATLSPSGSARWGATRESFFILQGQSAAGYAITSRGLPGLRSFTAKPYLDVDTLPLTPPSGPDDLDRYQMDLAAIENAVSFKGITVGPTAPPATFVPQDFLKTVQSYQQACVTRGWITNIGVANSLNVKLNAALAALKAGNTMEAANHLNSFLNEISALNNKQLSPEAVALLKTNTEYLLAHI
jgi:hypothetical protein